MRSSLRLTKLYNTILGSALNPKICDMAFSKYDKYPIYKYISPYSDEHPQLTTLSDIMKHATNDNQPIHKVMRDLDIINISKKITYTTVKDIDELLRNV